MKNVIILILLFMGNQLLRSQDKPNIVFILADDMGHSDMSWQGSPFQTPNLDKLAGDGMFLSRSYVQPQCTPTRIAFLTGNYPYRNRLHDHVLLTSSMHGILFDRLHDHLIRAWSWMYIPKKRDVHLNFITIIQIV